MTEEELLKLNLSDQVKYINMLMTAGHSLSIICKDIGLSKIRSDKLINHSYVYDKTSILHVQNWIGERI